MPKIDWITAIASSELVASLLAGVDLFAGLAGYLTSGLMTKLSDLGPETKDKRHAGPPRQEEGQFMLCLTAARRSRCAICARSSGTISPGTNRWRLDFVSEQTPPASWCSIAERTASWIAS